MRVQCPRLLDNAFHEVRRLHPSALSADIKLNALSAGNMTLPYGEPSLGPRQWVEIFGPYGTLGIFRTTKPRIAHGTQQQIGLEHGITTLGDELSPEKTTLTGNLREIMTALMGYQVTERWRLGACPADGNYTLEVDRMKLLQCVTDLFKQATGYGIEFDQSTSPWTVNVKKLSETPMCECRVSRNAIDVNVTLDDSELCTRIKSKALPGGYMDADTIGTWGVVSEDLDIADDVDAGKASAYAREVLENRKNPTVSIEIDGLYLAEITGEPMDAFRVGMLCRVALPDYGLVTNERLLSMRFSNLMDTPERVRLTLSTQAKDTSRSLAALRKSAETLRSTAISQGTTIRSHGGSITQMNVDLEKTYEYVGSVDGQLTEFTNYVGIQLDELNAELRLKASQKTVNALGTRVNTAEINLKGAEAAIELNASVTDALGNRIQSAEVDIDGLHSQITLKASKVVVDGILTAGVTGVSLLSAKKVSGNSGNFDSLSIYGNPVVSHSATLLKSVSLSTSKTSFTDYYGDLYTVLASASLKTSSETIVYLST